MVWLKENVLVATNTNGDDPTSCEKHRFCPPKNSWKFQQFSLKHPHFYIAKKGEKCLQVSLKISSRVTKTALVCLTALCNNSTTVL